MNAGFTPLPDTPTHHDLFNRLCVILDISDSMKAFADSVISKGARNEGDGNMYLVHECAERIFKEASNLLGGISAMESEWGDRQQGPGD